MKNIFIVFMLLLTSFSAFADYDDDPSLLSGSMNAKEASSGSMN
jgi:hypothetical protein